MTEGIDAERDLTMRLGRRLFELIPGAFERADFTVTAPSNVAAQRLTFTRADGRAETLAGDAAAASDALRLRAAMYRPGAGTWFAARFTVTAAGSMSSDFTYDDEPEWIIAPSPAQLAADLEQFPRDAEHLPGWLAAVSAQPPAPAEAPETTRALNDIGKRLYAMLGPADASAELRMIGVTRNVRASSFSVTGTDGTRRSIGPPDPEHAATRGVGELVDDLRASMYRPGYGTWFSARIGLTTAGRISADYNYDDEPDWDFPVDPVVYVRDLQWFPRDEAHMPAWLTGKLRDHAQGRTE